MNTKAAYESIILLHFQILLHIICGHPCQSNGNDHFLQRVLIAGQNGKWLSHVLERSCIRCITNSVVFIDIKFPLPENPYEIRFFLLLGVVCVKYL